MQPFEDFLATIYFPPNPFRRRDNSLPTDLSLSGQFSDGRFASQGRLQAGDPMPKGDTLTRFLIHPSFAFSNDQQVSDMVVFMLAFAGSELPEGSVLVDDAEPPGTPTQDTHAAVGTQLTVTFDNRNQPKVLAELADFRALADTGKVGLVAKGHRVGESRGYTYLGSGLMQTDRLAETTTLDTLRASVVHGEETTFTIVPAGGETRIGIDRDEDGTFDRDALDACGDPADPDVLPRRLQLSLLR